MNARALIAVLSCLAVASLSAGSDASSQLAPEDRALLEQALTVDGRAELASVEGIPLCRIAVRFDPSQRLLAGTMRIDVTNRGEAVLTDIAFHTFANAAAYHDASMVVLGARVDGEAVEWTMVEDATAVMLVLPRPLPSGSRVTIDMDYQARLSSEGGLYGLLGSSGDLHCLYNWHPELAVHAEGAWQVHPVGDHGDPTQNRCQHIIAEVILPTGVEIIASGIETARRANGEGWQKVTLSAPFTRNLAMVIGSHFERAEREVGGTTVRSWWLPGDEAGGARALEVAAQSLEFYAARFGPYPYADLDAVEAPLGDWVGGMESTGLVLITRSAYENLRWIDAEAPVTVLPVFMMAMTVSHEVAHQWWYNLVGSDAYLYPWLDESLTNWSGCYFFEQRYGLAAGAGAFNACLMQAGIQVAEPVDATLPAGDYGLERYASVVYGRGALMYQALRRRMGEERFLSFLRRYLTMNRFDYVTEREWTEALSSVAEPAEIEWFTRTWLKGEGLTGRDLLEASRPFQVGPP
jgi:hypothetical protein